MLKKQIPLPLLILFLLASTVTLLASAVAWRYPRLSGATAAPATDAAEKAGETVARHQSLRTLVKRRLDPRAATGLALTVALIFAVGGGALLGLLAYLVRSNKHLIGIDNGVAKWGERHASSASTNALNDITQLGSIYTIIGLCVLLAVVETIREKSIWVAPFILAVMGGEEVLTTTVKQLADRARPAFNPAAATLGPSFPSGHSATAAAFYATAALLLGRRCRRPVRAVLTGGAAGLAVAVAASRVLLDVHWLSDVAAGLALGWAWFAVCAIAFGGRILRFGAVAEIAIQVADSTDAGSAGPPTAPVAMASRRAAVDAQQQDGDEPR